MVRIWLKGTGKQNALPTETREGLTDEGILWMSGKTAKRHVKLQVLIEWSPELRAAIDESLAVDRGRDLTGPFIFGTVSQVPLSL